jgi:hypothetical protein
LRRGTSSSKASHTEDSSWFLYCFSSDLLYSAYILILCILFIVQCVILMSGFSVRKTGLCNARSVTGVLRDPFYVYTAISDLHSHISSHTEMS